MLIIIIKTFIIVKLKEQSAFLKKLLKSSSFPKSNFISIIANTSMLMCCMNSNYQITFDC